MAKRRERQRTAVRMVVDESGSMGSAQDETIRGHREFLDKLRETPADVRVSLDIFDNEVRTPYENAYLAEAAGLDSEAVNYDAMSGGGTSLYDAFGTAIDRQTSLSSEDDRVIMVVITDGYDTDSNRFNAASIKTKVGEKKATGKWEFIWLGPNQKGAQEVGIDPENTFVLTGGADGIRAMLAKVTERTTELLMLTAGTPESAASGS